MAELLRPSQQAGGSNPTTTTTMGCRRTLVTRNNVTGSTAGRLKTVLTTTGAGVKQQQDGILDAPDSNRPLHFKMENSYRMKPQEEKFQAGRVNEVMGAVLSERLKDVTYDPDTCQTLAKDLAAEIQKKVKDFRWQRYKVVCHVTVGQQTQQGLQVSSRCVWDQSVDTHASVTFNSKALFAVAQCYGIYFE